MDDNWKLTRELFDACIGMGRDERDAKLATIDAGVREDVLALLSIADRENSRRHRFTPLTILDSGGDTLQFRGRDEVTGEPIKMELFRVREEAVEAMTELLAERLENHCHANGNVEWLGAGVGPNRTAWIVTMPTGGRPLQSWLLGADGADRARIEAALER